jgi:ketosteroid isomerase-like protein
MGQGPEIDRVPWTDERHVQAWNIEKEREAMTIDDLEAFCGCWNRHDIEGLMSFMTDDCVFQSSAGPDACGTRYVGREAVRRGFMAAWELIPDAQWNNGQHTISGDRGLSEWIFTGTRRDGQRVEVTGCDVFTFRGDKIIVKDSFRKQRG